MALLPDLGPEALFSGKCGGERDHRVDAARVALLVHQGGPAAGRLAYQEDAGRIDASAAKLLQRLFNSLHPLVNFQRLAHLGSPAMAGRNHDHLHSRHFCASQLLDDLGHGKTDGLATGVAGVVQFIDH